jgi:uncharacterized protein (DUF849 family)
MRLQADAIINLAPTGMVPTRADTPHVPLTPEEIVADVLRCVPLGVSMAHLHARDGEGKPTPDRSLFGELVRGIRASCPSLVIVATTSGRRVKEVEQRAASLYLEGTESPDMASLTLGSMNFSGEASTNAPQTIRRLAEIMKERGIKPELEVFDLGMITTAKYLIDKGLVAPPYYFNFLLGNLGTAQANLLTLAAMLQELPQPSICAIAGLGRFQHHANLLGLLHADGVRIGLEDNLWFDAARTQLATNEALVRRVADQARAMGRTIASPEALRSRLGLPARDLETPH